MKTINNYQSIMRLITLLIIIGLVFTIRSYGQTQSEKMPSAAINFTPSGTNPPYHVNWIGLQNVFTENAISANVTLAKSGICSSNSNCSYSAQLQTTGYGFTIPTTAVITGIEVRCKKKAAKLNSIIDDGVYIGNWPSYSQVTLDKSAPVYWAYGEWNQTACCNGWCCYGYGSPTDLWGATRTPASVNAQNFGVRLGCRNLNATSSVKASIDVITITVYYYIGNRFASQTRNAGEITGWNLYPNPVTDNFNLIPLEDVSNASLRVYSTEGRLMFEKNIGAAGADESIQIEASMLPQGFYFVTITSEIETVTKRFVKH